MVVDPRLPDAREATPAGSADHPTAGRAEGLLGRLRSLLVVAGLVTLVVLSVLATVHLVSDVWAVRAIRGGWSAIVLRLLPVAVLSLTACGLALLVAWLAGSSRRREWAAIVIGFVVLVAVRLVVAFQLDGVDSGEPAAYVKMAESVLTPEWDFLARPMGYGFALAGVFAVVDDRQLGAEALNLLLAVLSGGVVLALARGLYGARAGALALLGYAAWPAAALMTVVSIPQLAFDLAAVAAAWAAVGTRPGWRGDGLTGAFVGLAQYARPTAPVMLPSYILARLWRAGSPRELATAVVVPVIACLLVLVPVVLYNLERTGSPSISTSDYGGHSLYMGTYEPSGGTFDEAANEALIELAGSNDVAARSEVGMAIAMQRIRDDPLGIAALGIRKQDTLWGTEHYGVQYAIGHRLRDRPANPLATVPMLLSQGFYVLVLVAATAGLWLRRRTPDALAPLVITTVWVVSAMHALVEVRDRHHSYVIPLLLPLAALALATGYGALTDRVARRRARS